MLALGVDLGTSKVAVAVVDRDGVQVHAVAAAHAADLPTSTGRFEQDAEVIIATAERLVRELPAALRARIAAIGCTGQMHGVVLHDPTTLAQSPLVTWQDQRVLEDPTFMPSLGRPLHAGYGLATLAWWARHGGLPEGTKAATIHGLLSARWAGLQRAPMDPTDAQAWGGLTPITGVKEDILPNAVGHGERIGSLAVNLGLPAGIPIAAPLGDNQASLRATLSDPDHELAFTIGTGCQLSAVVPRGSIGAVPGCDVRPFTSTHDALVAAPLVGGAAWLWLADTATSWVRELGLLSPSWEDVLALLDRLGLASNDCLEFRPHLAGERHDPSLTGTLHGLTLGNGRLGEVARALARGIAATARDMLPSQAFTGRIRVVASGNALRRSRLLLAMAEAEFALPISLIHCREEAATGAALVARELIASPQLVRLMSADPESRMGFRANQAKTPPTSTMIKPMNPVKAGASQELCS
jgi:sugar (pentulose or hexulose) kinase